MIINEDTVLVGSKVVLVPYLKSHVPIYHAWMQDDELQRLTASEPLSLEEEYEMQRKWRVDEDKLTFIILSRDGSHGLAQMNQNESVRPTDAWIQKLRMAGDVNVFLKGSIPIEVRSAANLTRAAPPPDHEEEDVDGESDNDFEAELEVMVAEPICRRQGLANEALQLILEYATGLSRSYFVSAAGLMAELMQPVRSDSVNSGLHIPTSALVARINVTNTPSIRLFEKLGFQIARHVEVFGEVEMRFRAATVLSELN